MFLSSVKSESHAENPNIFSFKMVLRDFERLKKGNKKVSSFWFYRFI